MRQHTLRITETKSWFLVELGDGKHHMLNRQSLVYFLKYQVGFDKNAIASIVHMFEYQAVVEIDLRQTERKVS